MNPKMAQSKSGLDFTAKWDSPINEARVVTIAWCNSASEMSYCGHPFSFMASWLDLWTCTCWLKQAVFFPPPPNWSHNSSKHVIPCPIRHLLKLGRIRSATLGPLLELHFRYIYNGRMKPEPCPSKVGLVKVRDRQRAIVFLPKAPGDA